MAGPAAALHHQSALSVAFHSFLLIFSFERQKDSNYLNFQLFLPNFVPVILLKKLIVRIDSYR
jgi:hypothetical protein